MQRRIHRKVDAPAPRSDAQLSRAPGKTTLVEQTFGHATSGGAQEVPHRAEMEQAFGEDFSSVKAYTGRDLGGLNAHAAASGESVAFATSSPSKELLAHELTHVVQERRAGGDGGVHAKSEVSSPGDASEVEADQVAARVASGAPAGSITASPGGGVQCDAMDSVQGVGELKGHNATGGNVAQSRVVDDDQKGPSADTKLPFTEDSWDAQTILKNMGQFDRSEGTDSDASRCVQAVGLASHILQGPVSARAYLADIESFFTTTQSEQRKAACRRVLNKVGDNITAKTATYGDLAWAQEALHDLYYSDNKGTDEKDVRTRIVPLFDMSTLEPMDAWCLTPEDVMKHVAKLGDKQQLVVTEFTVIFNSAFDKLEADGQKTFDGMTVNITDDDGKMVRTFRLSHIKYPPKPQANQINLDRDTKSGHQMLIYKVGADTFLYDPETTATGKHLDGLPDASAIAKRIKDDDKTGIFTYIQILGKITPPPPSQWGNEK